MAVPKWQMHTLVREASDSSNSSRILTWLHGYTMNSKVWSDIWNLMPEYTHLGIDLWGHGSSPDLPPGAGLTELAQAVASLMEAHRSRELISLSFGSEVALETAMVAPKNIDRLVLAAPTIAGRSDSPEAASRMRELIVMSRMGADRSLLTERWMKEPPEIFSGARKNPQLFQTIQDLISTHSWSELKTGSMARVQRTIQSDRAISSIKAKTLIMIGENDMSQFVRNADQLLSLIENSSLVQIPRTGHLPLLEDPVTCAQHLLSFFDSGIGNA